MSPYVSGNCGLHWEYYFLLCLDVTNMVCHHSTHTLLQIWNSMHHKNQIASCFVKNTGFSRLPQMCASVVNHKGNIISQEEMHVQTMLWLATNCDYEASWLWAMGLVLYSRQLETAQLTKLCCSPLVQTRLCLSSPSFVIWEQSYALSTYCYQSLRIIVIMVTQSMNHLIGLEILSPKYYTYVSVHYLALVNKIHLWWQYISPHTCSEKLHWHQVSHSERFLLW